MTKPKKQKLHLALPEIYAEQWAREIILCVRDPEWQKRFKKWMKENNTKTKKKKSTKKPSSKPH